MLRFLNYKHLLFFLLIALQMVIYNYPYIAKIEPRTVHAWRQYDCLSFAQGFYNDRGTLLEPCVNNLGPNNYGKAASDFPIVQFIIGNIWKITGINSFIYRFVNLLFLVWGLFYIYKLFLEEFKNKILAALFAALIFTSGNISYYGISTISDIQSFGLSMVGFYFFYHWIKTKNTRQLIIAILIFTLAGLLKASSAMCYVLCLLYLVFNRFEERRQGKTDMTRTDLFKTGLFVIPFIIWFIWFSYAKNYNIKYDNGFFLIGTLPIWEMDTKNIYDNLRSLFYNLLPQLLSPVILFSVLIFIIVNSFLNFKKQVTSSLMLLSCLFFFIMYIILFFGAFDVHDYYFINMTGVLVISLFFIFKIGFERINKANIKYVLLVLGFMVALNTYLSSIKMWKKTNFNVTNFENSLVFNSFEQKNFFWIYWFDREKFKALEDKDLNIEKAGVLRSDTIFCLGDESINRSLYLLNRVGYTNFNADTSNCNLFISQHRNIKYVVLIDTVLKRSKILMSGLTNKIYEEGALSIYKVK